MNVNCNECQKDFDITLKEKKHGKGIIETYFVCTHCNTRYTTTVTNQEIRRRIRVAAKMYEDLNFANDSDEFNEMNSKFKAYKTITTRLIEELKQEIASK